MNICMKRKIIDSARKLLSIYGNKKVGLPPSRWIATFDDPEIRSQFSEYGGGSVDLRKDASSGIAEIKINNPSKKNALTGKMMVDLADAVSDLESWKVGKALIIHGVDGYLCSGGDFATLEQILSGTDGIKMCELLQNTFTRLHNLPLISVSLVQGKALGGGAEMLTSTDFRLWEADAQVGYIQITLDILTVWGGGTRLVNLIGRRKALDLLSTGRLIKSSEAFDIGLADYIIKKGINPLDATYDWLSKYIYWSTTCVRGAKTIVAAATELNTLDALSKEKEVFSSVWGSPSHTKNVHKALKK